MKRKIMAAICYALSVFMLSSCQLAQENAGSFFQEDRMIGVFITTEHLDLFDFEGYLNNNLNRFSGGEIKMSGDTEKYQGRLYATLKTKILTNEETGEQTETQDYVFDDIEGIAYFAAIMLPTSPTGDSYTSSTSDETISAGHMAVEHRDEETITTLEGTIYIAPAEQTHSYYSNPVYQSADGSVYLTAGTGISSAMDNEGFRMSQSIDSTTTVTENGETTTKSLSITISFAVMHAPEKIAVVQMGADNKLLSQTLYDSDKMPEAIAADPNADYIIVETRKRSITGEQTIQREIYGKDAETIDYFIVRSDGICVGCVTQIMW